MSDSEEDFQSADEGSDNVKDHLKTHVDSNITKKDDDKFAAAVCQEEVCRSPPAVKVVAVNDTQQETRKKQTQKDDEADIQVCMNLSGCQSEADQNALKPLIGMKDEAFDDNSHICHLDEKLDHEDISSDLMTALNSLNASMQKLNTKENVTDTVADNQNEPIENMENNISNCSQVPYLHDKADDGVKCTIDSADQNSLPPVKFTDSSSNSLEINLIQDEDAVFKTTSILIPTRGNVSKATGKPILKEAKFGQQKKPREKLGERLGPKKLGNRLNKPLDCVSCDNQELLSRSVVEADHCQGNTFTPNNGAVTVKKDNDEKKSDDDTLCLHSNAGAQNLDANTNSWGSWGDWGSTIFTAASSFSREVGRGVGSVVQTVESSLGVPDPETLARESQERVLNAPADTDSMVDRNNANISRSENCLEKDVPDIPSKSASFGFGGLSSLGSLVSGVSGALETASTKVLLGGLDTLELIGRKTMDVLQEGDPGLRRKKAVFLMNNNTNLSNILLEARQRAATDDAAGGSRSPHSSSPGLGGFSIHVAWDATEGPAHMEALALVSRQCSKKMSTLLRLLPRQEAEMVGKLNDQIKSCSQLDEENPFDGEFESRVSDLLHEMDLPLSCDKLITSWGGLQLATETFNTEEMTLQDAQRSLYIAMATVLAQTVALAHKGAELALISSQANPFVSAEKFRDLSSWVCGALENNADIVCGSVSAKESADDFTTKDVITNIYIQASNSATYINEALVMFVSVMQFANAKQFEEDVA